MNLRAILIGGHALAGLAVALAIWAACIGAAASQPSSTILAASRPSQTLGAAIARLPAVLAGRPQVRR